MADTKHLLINVILYGLLPLWGIAGFIDWVCHRATHVERTSGLKESLIHSLMGLQLGIPILLCLVFEVNVLIFFICALMWVLHEIVAHWDVHYASPLRTISIWEVHVHKARSGAWHVRGSNLNAVLPSCPSFGGSIWALLPATTINAYCSIFARKSSRVHGGSAAVPRVSIATTPIFVQSYCVMPMMSTATTRFWKRTTWQPAATSKRFASSPETSALKR